MGDHGSNLTQALERNAEAVAVMNEAGWEIASHGLRWIDFVHMPEAEEKQMMEDSIARHTAVVGKPPAGWYTGRNSAATSRLVGDYGGFTYHSDSYSDDLPYYEQFGGDKPQLVVPYTFDVNDQKFASPNSFGTGGEFKQYLMETFDALYAEGAAGTPRMMSIGLHCRLAGRPARAAALAQFVDYVKALPKVWLCTVSA